MSGKSTVPDIWETRNVAQWLSMIILIRASDHPIAFGSFLSLPVLSKQLAKNGRFCESRLSIETFNFFRVLALFFVQKFIENATFPTLYVPFGN